MSRIIACSLGLCSSETLRRQSSPRGGERTHNSGGIGGGVAVLNRKPAVSLKRGKIRPRLLLMTNRKLHAHFRLVSLPKLMILDDLEGPLRTLFQNTFVFGANH